MAADGGKALVCVAQVGAPHGVRGAFHLRCFTAVPENVASYGTLCDERGRPLFDLKIVGPAKSGVIAAVPGVTDRNAAEALRGQSLWVPRERLPATDEDEYYHEDLVGLAARDAQGRELGKVVAVLNYGAGDILEIDLGQGRTELVPFTRAAVPAVDLAARTVEVVLP
jgi:16S rRNA processing protein RimM